MRHELIPSEKPTNPDFLAPIQGVTDPPNQRRIRQIEAHLASMSFDRRLFRRSRRDANVGLRFAADSMKSEMRGTISDLKREPLKTP